MTYDNSAGALPLNPYSTLDLLILDSTFRYLDLVRAEFSNQLDIYDKFLDIMKAFKAKKLDIIKVIDSARCLFASKMALLKKFNMFLLLSYLILPSSSCDLNFVWNYEKVSKTAICGFAGAGFANKVTVRKCSAMLMLFLLTT